MAAIENNLGPTLSALLNKSTMSTMGNAERIMKLSERLHHIQNSIDTDKTHKIEGLEIKMKAIQDKFKRNSEEKCQNQLALLKNHLSKLKKAMAIEKQDREGL